MVDRDRMLTARWSSKEGDILFHFPRKVDGHMLSGAFCSDVLIGGRTLRQELEARGYDITTLRFSIALKPPPPPPPAVMARAGAVGVDADGRPVDA